VETLTESIEARRHRAKEAKELLENKLLIEAFSAVEAAIQSNALMCDPDNKEKAQRIIISQQLLAGIKRELTRIVQDGTIAEVQLEEIERKKLFDLKRIMRR
jgi:hypothetical protein